MCYILTGTEYKTLLAASIGEAVGAMGTAMFVV
jgi:hypothetical protein